MKELSYIILGVVIVISIYLLIVQHSEHLAGNHIYTSGASMRIMGTQFSSTDQGSSHVSDDFRPKSWKGVPRAEHLSLPFLGNKSNLDKLKKTVMKLW